jgi:hypothetical protein
MNVLDGDCTGDVSSGCRRCVALSGAVRMGDSYRYGGNGKDCRNCEEDELPTQCQAGLDRKPGSGVVD